MINITCFNVTIALLYNKVNIIDKELLNACYTFCHLVFEEKNDLHYRSPGFICHSSPTSSG